MAAGSSATHRTALCFIGAGNMAEAIARGIISAGLLKHGQMAAVDPSPERLALFSRDLRIAGADDAALAAARSDCVILAVKPQKITEALTELKSGIHSGTLLISIVAAVSTRYIESILPPVRVIRVMPNTPMLVGCGASGMCRGNLASAEDMATARKLFGACGKTVEVPENLMDALTSLSGSGPAYVFFMAEALAAAGQKMGLPKAEAELLARQTIIGAGKMLAESTDSAVELRRKVTSPGGFTEAAIQTMEARGFGALMEAALAAAQERGRQLAR